MKPKNITLLLAILLTGCATPAGKQLTAIQNNPGVQAAETTAISIGGTLATGSPAFAYVAPIAVNGLTALSNGKNPIAVTGIPATDESLIISTIQAAIPNNAGTQAALAIAKAYTTGMAAPGVPWTPTGGNAVIAAIANGLTTGATQSN